MNRVPFRPLTLAVSIALAASVMALGDDDAGTLQRISDYRQWKKVNPEPVKVETSLNIDRALVAD